MRRQAMLLTAAMLLTVLYWIGHCVDLWPLSLIWFNLNPSMVK